MGKKWDYDVPGADVWRECLRVLKPGGHLLSFFGTRTYHRGVTPIEDAGFEIRDQIGWLYGSGFPKSSNQADEWEGWGTALKPAWEPIVVARKPLEGTVPQNLAAYQVGALNIDGCRVPTDEIRPRDSVQKPHDEFGTFIENGGRARSTGSGANHEMGRWPANIIHDGSAEVLDAFPSAPGQIAKASSSSSDARKTQNVYGAMKRGSDGAEPRDVGGSAARFFYCAKASRADRDAGMSAFETKTVDVLAGHRSRRMEEIKRPDGAPPATGKNTHPTVKPTTLMQWLCRLVTPPGGTVLDPFMGSGSTGRGAVMEGFGFVGIELDPEYAAISRARIAAVSGMTNDNEGIFS
jgi:site-specific DNA-methyltransferase (adenine-specific)